MNIEQRNVDELIPYANNARVHSKKQIEAIAASIKEFGFNNPVLTDGKNGVIAGHGRLMAAKHLGMKTVPVVELSHLTAKQKKAFILADNRLAEMATWDDGLVELELASLKEMDFDIGLTGFEEEVKKEPKTTEKIPTTHRCPECGFQF
jgi:ParB-like chromosome segregation protein Spo0J